LPYKFLDIIAADIAVEVKASSLEKVFSDSGIAVAATQFKNFKSIKPEIQKKISLRAENIEELFFKFLDELVFIKDTDNIILVKFDKIKIYKKGNLHALECLASGDKLDLKKHGNIVDIKAITMHMFEIKKKKSEWYAKFVLDV